MLSSPGLLLPGSLVINPNVKAQILAAGATPTWDWNLGGIGTLTLVNNITALTLQNIPLNGSIAIKIIQGGAGGFTVAWTGFKWSAGTPPVLTAAAGSIDIITACVFGGVIFAAALLNFS